MRKSLLGFSIFLALGSAVLAQPPASRSVLYATAGPELTVYRVDPEGAALAKLSSMRLPANVQYAWQHPSKKYFYIVWSDGGASVTAPGAAVVPKGKTHGLGAFRIDPTTGALQQIGQSVGLPSRPIHASVDRAGTHVLVAYNDPSSLTVYQIHADGTLGAQVKQPAGLDTGIYAHQIRTDPSNGSVFLVTRGNGPTKDKPEDRGAVKIFTYKDGVLQNRASIAPNGGVNFQPRHLDFHPTQPWVYVSLERQAKLQMYRLTKDASLEALPAFTKSSLMDPNRKTLRQNAGTLHFHPNGNFLYQANRSATVDDKGNAIDGGGENTIAVYSINPQTGEPTLIQSADTQGAEPRTFALDPNGRVLVAGNQTAITIGSGATAKMIPASLALFRIGADGKLNYVRKYDVDTKPGSLFWMGIVALP